MMLRDEGFRRQAVLDGITADHFHVLKPVYVAISDLAKAGAAIDDATVSAEVERAGLIDDIGGQETIAELWAETTSGRGWKQWIRGLTEALVERIKQDGIRWAADAGSADASLEALRTTAEAMKAAMAGPSRSKTAKEACLLLWAEIERLYKAGDIPGIATGIKELDAITGGMKAAQLWSILAETSRGKSVLMQQLACSAIRQLKRTAIFSAEMTVEEVTARLVSHRGGIAMDHLMMPKQAGKGHLQRIKTQLELMSEELFTIDDTPRMSLAHVEAEAQRLADVHGGLDLVVIDYVQILKAERGKNQNREEVVATISSGLKQLAKLLRCPVITGSQMNGSGKTRESEAIAFDSDVMIAILEDGLKMAKVRNGKRDEVLPYRLNGETQTFVWFNREAEKEQRAEENQQADEWASKSRRRGGRDRQFKA